MNNYPPPQRENDENSFRVIFKKFRFQDEHIKIDTP